MKTFSEKVLARKKRRLAKLHGNIIDGTLLFAVFICAGLEFYSYKSINAPTWADFKPTATIFEKDKLFETHLQFDDNGVPTDITIGDQQWSIVHADHYNNIEQYVNKKYKSDKPEHLPNNVPTTLAETYCQHRTISYITDNSQKATRITLLHEILHAGACYHGGDEWYNNINPTATYHPGIYNTSEFMTNFILSNPAFMNWYEYKNKGN